MEEKNIIFFVYKEKKEKLKPHAGVFFLLAF